MTMCSEIPSHSILKGGSITPFSKLGSIPYNELHDDHITN